MKTIVSLPLEGNPVRGAELRADAKERHVGLCKLIATMVETVPKAMSGQEWAGPMTQAQWATKAGLSLPAFKRLIKHPPIVVAARGVGRRKATLLRLGTVEPNDMTKVQNTISKLWREHIGPEQAALRDYKNDYGLCCGLAEDLPRGAQVRVFKHTLRNWEGFMSIAKLQIRIALELHERGIPPDPDDPDTEAARCIPPEDLKDVFLHFPCLSFFRRFHFVAVTVYLADMQSRQRPEVDIGG